MPDDTTILRFRHLLEKHKLAAQVLAAIDTDLAQQGLVLKTGNHSFQEERCSHRLETDSLEGLGPIDCAISPAPTLLGSLSHSAYVAPSPEYDKNKQRQKSGLTPYLTRPFLPLNFYSRGLTSALFHCWCRK